MKWRRSFFIFGLMTLLMAAATVAAYYHADRELDSTIYLPIAFRRPEPQILFFQVEPEAADPGQMVTLSWEVQYADRVILTRLWDFRPAEWWDNLPLIGTHNHTVPDWERNPIYFMLDAYDSVTGEHASASVAINVICPDTWFFSPPPGGCPTAPVYSPAAEQQFEHGVMIWVGAQDRLIVLFADNAYPRVANYEDKWDGGAICNLGPPPAGKLHPARGFGYLWCTEPMVRARLGWALEPEIGYDTILQWTTMVKYNHTYLRAADGNVWHLLPEFSGWEKIVVVP